MHSDRVPSALLAVVDTSLPYWRALRDALPVGVDVLAIDSRDDGLDALTRAMAARASHDGGTDTR